MLAPPLTKSLPTPARACLLDALCVVLDLTDSGKCLNIDAFVCMSYIAHIVSVFARLSSCHKMIFYFVSHWHRPGMFFQQPNLVLDPMDWRNAQAPALLLFLDMP